MILLTVGTWLRILQVLHVLYFLSTFLYFIFDLCQCSCSYFDSWLLLTVLSILYTSTLLFFSLLTHKSTDYSYSTPLPLSLLLLPFTYSFTFLSLSLPLIFLSNFTPSHLLFLSHCSCCPPFLFHFISPSFALLLFLYSSSSSS